MNQLENDQYNTSVPKHTFVLAHEMSRISGPFKDERMFKALMTRVKEKDREVAEKNKQLIGQFPIERQQKIKDDIEKLFI